MRKELKWEAVSALQWTQYDSVLRMLSQSLKTISWIIPVLMTHDNHKCTYCSFINHNLLFFNWIHENKASRLACLLYIYIYIIHYTYMKIQSSNILTCYSIINLFCFSSSLLSSRTNRSNLFAHSCAIILCKFDRRYITDMSCQACRNRLRNAHSASFLTL